MKNHTFKEVPGSNPSASRRIKYSAAHQSSVKTKYFATLFVAASAVAGQSLSGVNQSDNPVARLQQQIDKGEVNLEFHPDRLGYLPSLLQYLSVNVNSQVLVFSKTSFQSSKISPRTPRAIFFNDSVAVGSVQGGEVLELAALDPKEGMVFYTLDVHKSDKPQFTRNAVCLQCHQGTANKLVPGIMVDSVYPSADGTPLFTGAELPATDHRTPFEDRWGGWYVTGTHGAQHHMGNAVAPDPARPADLESSGTQNVTSLAGKFDPAGYLSTTSDIVALMTLEHQTRMTNLITSVSRQARERTPAPALNSAIDEMVTYMLFADEAPLGAPVAGVSTFTKTFPARGPRDKHGRSLRDFDLKTRLFRYPLSYMIYSEAFDAMPENVRDRIYQRLYDVLTGNDTRPQFARISADDRRSILEILRDTKPGLPAYWQDEANSRFE